MRAALSTLGKQKEFGELFAELLARLANESLQYFLSKNLNTNLGEGMRFATMNQKAQFDSALTMHTREASLIVETFSAGWFSKHRFEESGVVKKIV